MDARDIEDLFRPAGPVSVRRMFGGQGVFAGPMMVAIAVDGILYMKGDAEAAPVFAAAGSERFSYMARGVPRALGFWRLPEDAFEDPDQFMHWYRVAEGAARRAAVGRRRRGQAT